MTNDKSSVPALTPELWGHIFCSLEERDIQSAINAFPEWNEEPFKELKALHLFPLIFPQLAKYLTKHAILILRHTRKSWKNAVDITLQNHPSFFTRFENHPFDSTAAPPSSMLDPVDENGTIIKSRVKMFDLINTTNRNYTWNPFPTRSVIIKDYDEDDKDSSSDSEAEDKDPDRELPLSIQGVDFHECVLGLLEGFSQHIWHLTYHMSTRIKYQIKRLYSILTYLPQLRTLKLYCDPNYSWSSIYEQEEKSFLTRHPFPTLEHLVSLELCGPTFHLKVARALLDKYETQLLTLVCHSEIFSPCYFNSDLSSRLSNMRNLKIALPTNSILKDIGVSQAAWPLERLFLSGSSFLDDDKWIPLRSLIRAINRFSTTLKELHLLLPIGDYASSSLSEQVDSNQVNMKFKQLKILRISQCSIASPVLHELLKCKFQCVERLEIEQGRNVLNASERDDPEIAQERRSHQIGMTAVFWKVLQGLEVVGFTTCGTVECEVYRRG